MIVDVQVQELGPIAQLSWLPSPVNVVIGYNASGKTMLLKMLWALVRSREIWKRGNDPRTYREVLADKLYWTFQTPRLGQIVRQGQATLSASIEERMDGMSIKSSLTLGARSERKTGDVIEPEAASSANAIFVPAKEVLSVSTQVKQARKQQQFGFDEPTVDLVDLLEFPVTRGAPLFGSARQEFEDLIGARIDQVDGSWMLKRANGKFPVSVAAEGHKKIAIFDRLILNRTLQKNSLLFIDEPEAFLHPEALLKFLKILTHLSEAGVQVFLATHSIMVLNALRLYASSSHCSVSCLSLTAGQKGFDYQIDDLAEGMPENAIVNASIALYEMEMRGSLDGI